VTASIAEWSPDRIADLVHLTDHALAHERLTADELASCCFEDATVLGFDGAEGAAVVWSMPGTPSVAMLKLLAVLPSAQGYGHGRALLDEAITWARDHGAHTLGLGASAPYYLWPGVDVHATRMLALVESAGFVGDGTILNMGCATTFRAPVPEGIVIERVIDDAAVERVAGWAAAEWPHWDAELRRGAEHGSCVAAFASDGAPVGFACHSVNRAGWFGPTGTDPAWRHRGIGAALLGACCRDLMAAGHTSVEIAWIGPLGFYARTAGAVVSRVFRAPTLTLA
jgi:GNAT superfamily N-acetyltransferase